MNKYRAFAAMVIVAIGAVLIMLAVPMFQGSPAKKNLDYQTYTKQQMLKELK